MSNAENQDSKDGHERGPFFELYDLKVEVIAPPGARILCGARPGDWFELRGSVRFQTANGEQEVGLPELLEAAKAAGLRWVTLREALS